MANPYASPVAAANAGAAMIGAENVPASELRKCAVRIRATPVAGHSRAARLAEMADLLENRADSSELH